VAWPINFRTRCRCAWLQRFLAAQVVVLIALAGLPALAGGAVTVGQTIAPIYNCDGTYEIAQTGVAAGTSYTVPSDGVITSWSSQGTAMGATTVKIKLFRPTGTPDQFTVVGQSDLAQVPASSAIASFPTRIAVRAGDMLGISKGSGGCAYAITGSNADTNAYRAGDAPNGEIDSYTANTQARMDVSAQLEPDADGDGFGDESQDKCVGTAGKVAGCPKADLLLTKTASAAEVPVGASITYTLTAYNLGPEHAPAVAVSDPTPSGFTVIAASSSAGICSLGPPVSCAIGELGNGASATVTITGTATTVGVLTNTANVSSVTLTQASAAGAGDPDSANNTASATTAVDAASQNDPFAGVTLSAQVARLSSSGEASIRVGCPADTPGGCNGTLVLKSAAKIRIRATAKKRTVLLGRSSLTIQSGKTAKVFVKVSSAGRQLLRRRGNLGAIATVTARDGLGTTKSSKARITLKAKKRP
jgi:uncharacterized repeat protein (TIGR01451 family)